MTVNTILRRTFACGSKEDRFFFLILARDWSNLRHLRHVLHLEFEETFNNGGIVTANNSITPPTPKSIASYVKRNASKVKKAQRHMHRATESVREADYKGHHIVIRTTYRIEVDGVPLMGHMGVTDDGHVHYHPVPNASFASAVDLVKELIDVFPDDFTGEGGPMHGGSHMHMRHSRRKSKSQGRRAKKRT